MTRSEALTVFRAISTLETIAAVFAPNEVRANAGIWEEIAEAIVILRSEIEGEK
jgi:hypothetical protein